MVETFRRASEEDPSRMDRSNICNVYRRNHDRVTTHSMNKKE